MFKIYIFILFSFVKNTFERTLILIPNIRFCPGENCEYAVIANKCENCPKLKCESKKCGIHFCYHCKGKWHSNKSCTEILTNRITKKMEHWSHQDLRTMYEIHQNIIKGFAINNTSIHVKLLY